jgi:hypothetical protein
MTDSERDAVYTGLCRQMTELGEAQAPLFLARLALLAFERLDDAEAALGLIGDAARDLQPGARAG